MITLPVEQVTKLISLKKIPSELSLHNYGKQDLIKDDTKFPPLDADNDTGKISFQTNFLY